MGIDTGSMSAAIKAKIYSGVLRSQLEPELLAMNYVDVITSFPEGDKWEDVEIGSARVHDYKENSEVLFDGLEIGTREFEINNYVQSGHYVTAKFVQDSYLAGQIMAKIGPLQARAIYADLETKVLNLILTSQTKSNANSVNGCAHRFLAADKSQSTVEYGVISPEDILFATVALTKAMYTGPLVAIIPSYQTYKIGSLPNLQKSLQFNPRWEGIVKEGVSSGMKFAFSIMGVDVYTSEFLPVSNETGLKDRDGSTTSSAISNAALGVVFANIPDRRPFRMAWRQMPKFEGEWNMHKQREEYVTTARYGVGVGDKENMIVIQCANNGSFSSTVA